MSLLKKVLPESITDAFISTSAVQREIIQPDLKLVREDLAAPLSKAAGMNGIARSSLSDSLREWNMFTHKFDLEDVSAYAKESSAETVNREFSDRTAGTFAKIFQKADSEFGQSTSWITKGQDALQRKQFKELPEGYTSASTYIQEAVQVHYTSSLSGRPIPEHLQNPELQPYVDEVLTGLQKAYNELNVRRRTLTERADIQEYLINNKLAVQDVTAPTDLLPLFTRDGVSYYNSRSGAAKGNPFEMPLLTRFIYNTDPNVLRGMQEEVEEHLSGYVSAIIDRKNVALREVGGELDVQKETRVFVNTLIDEAEGTTPQYGSVTLDELLEEGLDLGYLSKFGTGDAFATFTRKLNLYSKQLEMSASYGGHRDVLMEKIDKDYDVTFKKIRDKLKEPNITPERKASLLKLREKVQAKKVSEKRALREYEDSYYGRGAYADVDSTISQFLQDASQVTTLKLGRQVVSQFDDFSHMFHSFGTDTIPVAVQTFMQLGNQVARREWTDILNSMGYALTEALHNRNYDFIAHKQSTGKYDPFRIKGLTTSAETVSANIQRISGANMLSMFQNRMHMALLARQHMRMLTQLKKGNLSNKMRAKLERSLMTEEDMRKLLEIEGMDEVLKTKDPAAFFKLLQSNTSSIPSSKQYMQSLKDEALKTNAELLEGMAPTFFSTPLGKVLLQFNGFLFTSLSKRVITGVVQRSRLDQEGMDMASGVMISALLTMLGNKVRAELDGKEYEMNSENAIRSFMNSSPMGPLNFFLGPALEGYWNGSQRAADAFKSSVTPAVFDTMGEAVGLFSQLGKGEWEKAQETVYRNSGVRLWLDMFNYASE